MTYEEFNLLAGGIGSLGTAAALLVAAFWTYTRFVRQREDFPLIDFSADVTFVGVHEDAWVVELTSTIENKGKVRHRMVDFKFDLFALQPGDRLEPRQEFGGQVAFPHTVVEGSWLPKRFDYFHIDPGTKAKYSL